MLIDALERRLNNIVQKGFALNRSSERISA
jgi:hypothetical protein